MPEIVFIVNDLTSFTPDQTTAQLVWHAAARSHRVWVTTPTAWGRTPTTVEALATPVVPGPDPQALVQAIRQAPQHPVDLASIDAVWVRTNPGRAAHAHDALLQLLHQVVDQGVPVLNHPAGLTRAASKLYLGSLPVQTVPRTFVSDDPARLRCFLERLGGHGVLKPALGTRGQGVQRVHLDAPDLDATLEQAAAEGMQLLQAYLPDAPNGDVRVHVVDGQLLEVDGRAALVRRRPGEGEWRSNVALGGQPMPAEATESLRDIVEQVGPILRAHGLWHVGLDVVGDRIVECNVFSPGGLADASRFAERDFHQALVDRFLDAL